MVSYYGMQRYRSGHNGADSNFFGSSGRFARWKCPPHRALHGFGFHNFISFLRVFLAFFRSKDYTWDIRRVVREVEGATLEILRLLGRFVRRKSLILKGFQNQKSNIFQCSLLLFSPKIFWVKSGWKYTRRVIEVVITGLTRNQLSGSYRTKGSNPLPSATEKACNQADCRLFSYVFF